MKGPCKEVNKQKATADQFLVTFQTIKNTEYRFVSDLGGAWVCLVISLKQTEESRPTAINRKTTAFKEIKYPVHCVQRATFAFWKTNALRDYFHPYTTSLPLILLLSCLEKTF